MAIKSSVGGLKFVLLTGVGLLILAAGGAPTFAQTDSYTARVVSVLDGDSLSIDHNGKKERLILFGVDCPELNQPFGEQARQFTDGRAFKKTVSVQDRGRDSRGRTIAVVYLPDGTNLNQELVKQGLAWWSDKYAPNEANLQALHQEAKAAHRGLWNGPNPVPPWIWRNGQKEVQATIKAD